MLGAQNLIKAYKPKIIIEIRNENKLKIQEFFNKFNYKLFDISNMQNNINLNDFNIKKVMNIFCQSFLINKNQYGSYLVSINTVMKLLIKSLPTRG